MGLGTGEEAEADHAVDWGHRTVASSQGEGAATVTGVDCDCSCSAADSGRIAAEAGKSALRGPEECKEPEG